MSHQRGNCRILDGQCVLKGPDTVGPPIQLFNPAFAYFTSKAFDPELVVPPTYMNDVYKLVKLSAAIYTSENLIGHLTVFTQNADGTAPDGVVLVPQGHNGLLHLVIYEEKREFGDGGVDPSTQAAFSYWHIFFQPDAHDLCLATCCPTFIIAHASP
ncbi:hypothetical protein F5141DRAFT_1067716 [Pisolithus sp. B1]|nr:hypothetical protein F5141DRAFT_1067716 [Pisolithus sp. B1]